ncbi:hypothetical protein WL35_16985 [Burkholderia ubonensis]|nr:hypothetical protein WL35_16985 [Burkholderia ubonensis]
MCEATDFLDVVSALGVPRVDLMRLHGKTVGLNTAVNSARSLSRRLFLANWIMYHGEIDLVQMSHRRRCHARHVSR